MVLINLVVFKHACDKRGKRKKKATLAILETIIACSPPIYGGAAETLRLLSQS
jgi:hypothetical protein